MKEKNVLFGTIAMINVLMLFILVVVCRDNYMDAEDWVLIAFALVNVFIAIWLWRRSLYKGRALGTVVNIEKDYSAESSLGRNAVVSKVTASVEYTVDGKTLRNRISGAENDFQRVRIGSRLQIGYRKDKPYKIIWLKSLFYVQVCIITIIELICLIILVWIGLRA